MRQISLGKITVIIFFFVFCAVHAQELPYEKITMNGKMFYIYHVKAGEGLYFISRTFSVNADEILKFNPTIENGLKSGQVLYIPINDASQTSAFQIPPSNQSPVTTPNKSNTFKHIVLPGETVYSLAQMYHTTVEEIYRYNPTAREMIKVGQELIIPQPVATGKDEHYRYHTIMPKETLYSLARLYSIKPEDIIAANPGLSEETFQIGKTIRIPFPGSNETVVSSDRQIKHLVHKVKKGDTLYSIARQYGVSVEEIQRVNSLLSDSLKADMELLIPVVAGRSGKGNRLAEEIKTNLLLRPNKHPVKVDVIKVGLLMPFLDETDKMHLRLQEYYEGLLLAVDKLKDQGANIELYVFEIGKGDDIKKLKSLLETMEMKSLNLIIGGVSDKQIKLLSDFSASNNIKYVVPFSSKNTEVLSNSNIFQVNSPQSYIYSKTSRIFSQIFKNSNVVFLKVDGKSDKDDFINTLQTDLKQNNIYYRIITIDNLLEETLLPLLVANKENVIVPTSADASSLRQTLEALKMIQQNNTDYTLRLFGYPEWQTYDSNFKNDYHKFGTYIYSSFFVDDSDVETKEFIANFRKWYRRDVMNIYPRYAMLGYDTGLFFLSALYRYGLNFEQNIHHLRVKTVQFAFNFERVNNWGGFINTGLYLVYYSPDYKVIKFDKSR
ncbi:PBP1 and LysM peptidoglycan-binding domain-containing protein [Anaerorudis cellulosivorans]|uniref:PBP1 and LysM peptidoglycan-binding domain-containing protein n=1 Tax=Anaerorudis cellulosivorans TaxID=3397862 RepID=UPI00221FF99A|nr:LysM peptidoglycan-binding domain-containing protein [Seramator thermalis]MCW1736180.1 LysM peptidoglycan-binding domain-containing protein [Seramator thermalis]